jgi:hypothetical protein
LPVSRRTDNYLDARRRVELVLVQVAAEHDGLALAQQLAKAKQVALVASPALTELLIASVSFR